MISLETVWTSNLSPVDGAAYDAFVAHARSGHLFQTRAWSNLAGAAIPSKRTYFLARHGAQILGSAVLVRRTLFPGIALPFAKIERGPVCDDPDLLPAVLESLLALSRRRGILHLTVMPYWSGEEKTRVEHLLQEMRFSDVQRHDGSHVRSLRLDLTSLSSDALFEGSAFAKVRHEIRRAERAGARSRRGALSDLKNFRELHENRMRSEGHRVPNLHWYEALADYFVPSDDRGTMFVSEYRSEVIALVFVARLGPIATFVFGETTPLPLPFSKMIQPLAAAISWAKTSGLRIFDLGGIPMEGDTDRKRASIAEFKRGFSRSEISFVHAHARWL